LTAVDVAAPPTTRQSRFPSAHETADREAAGRIVLVTGAGGGVGHTVSLRWLDAGAQVVAVGRVGGSRGLDDLSAAWAERAGDDPAALARLVRFGADVTTQAGAEAMVAEAERAFAEPADTLLHLVGGFAQGRLDAPNAPETWRRLLALNLDSAFYCYRAVLAGFQERGSGWIVGIGSRAVLCPPAQMAAYAASKAGLVALTQSLSAEVRDAGIHVNLLLASTIDTPANRAAMGHTHADTWVRPDDIADATLYLCSERARAIHGATLEVFATAP
jgi:NAD(P)-dependent dehydrogenase (short-subunit alcohol dehydrogenase family)